MKKILSVLLAATMLVALFVLPSAAADNVNYGITIDSTEKAPVVDGKIGTTEYGLLPIHTYSESKSQFDHTKNNDVEDWDFSFYATWDADNLYLAWKVNTPRHAKLPLAQFDASGNPIEGTELSDESLGYLWMHSCIQLGITPGEPVDGTSNFGSNYLNMGFGQLADDSTGKAIWAYPNGVLAEDIKGWEAICTRDDASETTIYEIAIPWKLAGVPATGDGSKFGLSYVVFAQEHVNIERAGIQWQTGCFYMEDINKAGVVELNVPEGQDDISIDNSFIGPGRVPTDLREKEQLFIPKFNTPIGGEDATLITDLEGDYSNAEGGYNFNYALTWVLKPIEDDLYEIVEVISNTGSAPVFTTLEEGCVIVAFHSDGQGVGNEAKNKAATYKVGTKVGIWGIDIDDEKQEYSNSFVYIEEPVLDTPVEDSSAPDESTTTEDPSTPDEPVTSTPATSEDDKTNTSTGTTESEGADKEDDAATTESSEAEKDEEGGNTVLIIVIVVVVVAAIAAAVVIVLKKKKA